MSDLRQPIYIQETRAHAVFQADGPQPQFLFESPEFKTLVVGLEAGQQIPQHPGEAAVYHFIDGVGIMTVGDETFAIRPGVTVVAPRGVSRGMNAKTRIIFLGAKGA